jgi:hypothetical protein
LGTAIEVLLNHHNTAANILIEDAGSLMQLPEVQSFPITIITRNLRWSMITKRHFEKWFPKDTSFRISPGTDEFFEISGVEISDGVCRVLSDGLISLKSHDPFWIGEFL